MKMVQYWNNVSKLPREKIAKINDKSTSLADKIALYDFNVCLKEQPRDKNAMAYHHRMLGNVNFEAHQYENAIDEYNKGLCLTDSPEDKGIFYANRAAAFLALNSYQDCLDSVHLAKEYPLKANTMEKVLAWEQMAIGGLALELILKNRKDNGSPTVELSYRRNKRIPSFVFCLDFKIAGNPYGGIVTSVNVLPGDVLVVEPPLIRLSRYRSMCNYCFRKCGSLQPCICGHALYCSPKCKENAFKEYHNYECPLMDNLCVVPNLDCLILRVFFKLIQRFKDVASLREYLESINTTNPFEACNPGSFESQFRIYSTATERPSAINCIVRKNKLFRTDYENKIMVTAMAKAAVVINMLKTCKKVPRLAKNKGDWSFLSEVLFRLIYCKGFAAISVSTCDDVNYDAEDDSSGIIMNYNYGDDVTVLHGSASLIRTSCQENVVFYYDNNNMLIVRALSHIPRGTELLAPNYNSIINACAIKAWYPKSTFDLSKACFCADCQGWFRSSVEALHILI